MLRIRSYLIRPQLSWGVRRQHESMNPKHLVFSSTLVPVLLSCSRASRTDYRTADPIADASRALSQDDYRVVGVKLGDSILAPVDSAVGSRPGER